MKNSLLLLARTDYASNRYNFILYSGLLLVSFIFFDVVYGTIEEPASQMLFFNIASEFYKGFIPLLIAITFAKSYKRYWRRDSMFINMLPTQRAGKFIYMVLRDFILIPGVLILLFYINYLILKIFIPVVCPFMTFDFSIWNTNSVLHMIFCYLILIFLSFPFRRMIFFLVVILYFTISWVPNSNDLLKNLYTESYGVTVALSLLVIGMFYCVWLRFKRLQLN